MIHCVVDHLIDKLVAAYVDDSGHFVDPFQLVKRDPHGDHFFFRLSRDKFSQKTSPSLLTIVFFFDKIVHIQNTILIYEYSEPEEGTEML